MTAMILDCGACGAQNFVSAERLAAAHVPPACWKCGTALPVPAETRITAAESNRDDGGPTDTGDREE